MHCFCTVRFLDLPSHALTLACHVCLMQGDSFQAWKSLGAVMLCVTGAEALYEDLGHFNQRSVQVREWGFPFFDHFHRTIDLLHC